MMTHDHVAVLVEPPVHPGLAVLINSLVRNGFGGTIWVGHRGPTPDWVPQAQDRVTVSGQTTVRFLRLATDRPFTYMKAAFLEDLWSGYCPDAESIAYFDSDIAINRDWEFFRAWMRLGIAVCEDAPHMYVHESHPLRLVWAQRLASMGVAEQRTVSRYYNAGFIGVHRKYRTFLPRLREISREVERAGHLVAGNAHAVRGIRERDDEAVLGDDALAILRPYFADDQDALNMTLMASSEPFAAMGPDAMGFTPSWNFAMVHAVGSEKPWATHFLRRSLRRGTSPSAVERTWWRYADGPLAPLPAKSLLCKRAGLVAATVLGTMRGR